jgi:hypothetical protein
MADRIVDGHALGARAVGEEHLHGVEWIFSPRLNLDIENVAGLSGWDFGVGAGPIFGADKFHDYFYSVAPRFANANRRAYDARGGYSGTQFLTSRLARPWNVAPGERDNDIALSSPISISRWLIEQWLATSGRDGAA